MEKNEKITAFTDLNTWKEAHQLVLKIYMITKLFPQDERYSLVDQMRRAAVSVTSNIAEGFGRRSYKERLRFYLISRGSLSELTNQLMISRDLHYLPEEEYELCTKSTDTTAKLLNGLITKTDSLI